MSQSENDVLSCSSGFSGFEEDEVPNNLKENVSPSETKLKSVVVKPAVHNNKSTKPLVKKNKTQKKSKTAKSSKPSKTKCNNSNLVDLNNMSADDLELLKSKLGIPQFSAAPCYGSYDDIEDEHIDLNSAPNMHIELSNEQNSDDESVDSIGIKRAPQSKPKDMSKRLIDSMFGEEGEISDNEEEWKLPKIKTRNKGESVSNSLAKAINMACTPQCETESLSEKYFVPENCEMLNPPLVNSEVWKHMDRRSRSYDRLFQEIQGLLAAGVAPILQLAKILKPAISANQDAKQMISDSVTLLGQVQYNLSIRRRYLIRPNINKKYKNLCSISTPLSTLLFGDDIPKEIKTCDAGLNLGRDRNFQSYGRYNYRGRYPRQNFYRGRGRSAPYIIPQDPQQNYGYRGGYGAMRGFRRGSRPTATATAPNEGN